MADPDAPASENPFDQMFSHGLGSEPAGIAPAASTEPPNPFDEMFRLDGGGQQQPETSTSTAVGLHAGLGAAPMAGGLIGAGRGVGIGGAIGAALFGAARGAGVGAAAGAAIPGLGEVGIGELGGGIVGGLVGGFGGAWATGKAQDYAIKQLPDTWRDPLEREIATTEKEHPMASFMGGLIPMAVTMTPFSAASALPANATAMQRIMQNPATARVFGGLLQGGIEAGHEVASGDPLDWRKVAISTGFGLVFNRPNALGTRIESIGARARPAPVAPIEPARPAPEIQPERQSPDVGEFGDLYDAMFPRGEPVIKPAPVHEDAILGLEAPTIYGAWGSRVAGPQVTEEVFHGSQEMDPQTKMIAEDRERNETAVYKPPPAPDVGVVARTMNPELFDEHDAALSRVHTLQRYADELRDGPDAEIAEAHLEKAVRQAVDLSEQVAVAHRAAAEAVGQTPIREAEVLRTPVELVGGSASAAGLDEQRQFIQQDLERRYVAAGRPPDVANAEARIVTERYVTRAERMEGRLGSPAELYLAKGAELRGPGGKFIPFGVRPGGEPEVAPTVAPGPKSVIDATEVKAKADSLGVSNLVAKLKGAGSTPEEISTFISKKLTPDEIEAFPAATGARRAETTEINPAEVRAKADNLGVSRLVEKLKGLGGTGEEIAASIGGKLTPEEIEAFQGENAKIRIRPGKRSVIELFSTANASSLLHEESHDWLAQLLEDGAHPEAPEQIRRDAQATRRWLGIGNGRPTTSQHERWANTFEQYLREGIAPSARLASVFAKFKNWLLDTYKTLRDLWGNKKFEETVSPDIRALFDRLLSPEAQGRGTVIGSSLERGKTLADIHEQDAAEITNPFEMGAAAMRVDAEAAQHDANIPPEIAHEIESASAEVDAEQEQAGGEGSRPGTGEGADAAGGAGNGPGERGAVGEDRGQPKPQPERGRVGIQPGEELSGKREPVGGSDRGPEQRSGDGEATRPGQPPVPRPSATLDRDTPLVDKAGNIRIENLTTREDVAQAIRDAADANDGFIGDRQGVITDGQVEELASALGMDADMISRRRIGQAFNAVQVMAARKLLIQSATDVAAKMRAAAIGDDNSVLEYALAKNRHQMIQAQVAGITAEAGRALRAFRTIAMQGEQKALAADQFIKNATGQTLYQLREEAKLGSAYDTPEQVSKMMADAIKRDFGDKVLEYWINGLISGFSTHVTYAIGNTILAAVKAGPETAVAAIIGGARRAAGREGTYVRPGEVGAKFGGALRGLPGAFQAAAESFSSGVTARLPGEKGFDAAFDTGTGLAPAPSLNQGATYADAAGAAFANIRGLRDGLVSGAALLRAGGIKGEPIFGSRYSPLGAIQDFTYRGVNVAPVGTLARLPSRFIAAIHAFFRATNFSMEKSALAYRMASEEGRVGAAFDQRVGELWQNPTTEIMNAATHEATEATLMGRGGEFTQALAKLTNARIFGFKLAKFIDPFVRISGNIIEQTLVARTPLGILAPEIRADLMGRNGNIAQDTAQARMLVGTALSVTFGGLAASGFASGSGPSDPRKAAMWRLAGNQAHSVRIGDMWYDVHRLGPMGMLMSVAADMYDVAHAAASGDMLLAGATLQHAITQNILDESFMRGPADLIKAMEDPGRYGEAYLRNWASSFVPYSVGMAQLARAMDPYSRQARTVMDAIKNKVPGESETLFPRRDVWGEPMANPDALIAAGVTSIYERRMSTDPVNLSLLSLGIAPASLERKIRNVQLDDNQYDDFQRLAGRMTKQRLDIIVNSADFQSWPSHVQHDVITETIRQSREAARGVLMMKYPQIIREAMDAKRARLTGTGQ